MQSKFLMTVDPLLNLCLLIIKVACNVHKMPILLTHCLLTYFMLQCGWRDSIALINNFFVQFYIHQGVLQFGWLPPTQIVNLMLAVIFTDKAQDVQMFYVVKSLLSTSLYLFCGIFELPDGERLSFLMSMAINQENVRICLHKCHLCSSFSNLCAHLP